VATMVRMFAAMLSVLPREHVSGCGSTKRRVLTLATVLVTVLGWEAQASAQLPNDTSAVDQYVEDVPDAGGSVDVRTANSTRGGTASADGIDLPSSVASALKQEGGRDAESLRQLATSPVYGAPRDRLGRMESSRETLDLVTSGRLDGEAPTTAIGTRLLGLLAALAVISAVALAAVLLRRRRSF